jgi:hypothetical protein
MSSVIGNQDEIKRGLGLKLGGSVLFPVTEKLAIATGLNFHIRGAGFFYERDVVDDIYSGFSGSEPIDQYFIYEAYEYNALAIYGELPVTAKYYFTKKPAFYATFGAYVAALLTAYGDQHYYVEQTSNYSLATEFTGYRVNEGVDLSHVYSPIDYGLIYGVGLAIPLNEQARMHAELSFQQGLADVVEQVIDKKNRAIVASATFYFGKKKSESSEKVN